MNPTSEKALKFSEAELTEKAEKWVDKYFENNRPGYYEVEAPYFDCEVSFKAGYIQCKKELREILEEKRDYFDKRYSTGIAYSDRTLVEWKGKKELCKDLLALLEKEEKVKK